MSRIKSEFEFVKGSENYLWKNCSEAEQFKELKSALINSELELAGQPIFNIDTHRIEMIEVLLRWNHKEYGEIAPESIIGLAGKYNHLYEIALYVTKKFIKFYNTSNHVSSNTSFSINLNMPQIININLIKCLLLILDDAEIDRSRIVFESTESCANPISVREAAEHFSWIRNQGIRIAIDDFGSGYSSLDFINSLDVDIIKIDKSLVDNIDVNSRRYDTLLSLMNLCGRHGVVIVIEGVENSEQHKMILNSGLNNVLVQGYFYEKPALLNTYNHRNIICC